MAGSPRKPSSRGRKVGMVGTAVGLVAAGVAVSRVASRRTHTALPRGASDAELRSEDPLGLASRPADRTALVQTDDGVLLSVEEIGPSNAPMTLVFVHGYTLSMASWTFQRRTLAEQLATANGHRPDARLVFYDHRGHGASGRGRAERATIEQLAADLAAVLAARVPRGPVVLVGHSMGGMTIMGLAALHPELFGDRVVGVALISTSSGNLSELTFGLPDLLTRVRTAVLPVAAWTMRHIPRVAEGTRRVAADLVATATRSLSFASTDVDPLLARYVDAMIAGTPVDVIAEFYPALAGMDHTGALEPLRRIPTLVLTGEKDTMIPKAHSEEIVEHLGGASETTEFVIVPDAGHMVLLEQPAAVTAALTRLLRRVAELPARTAS